MRKWFGGEFKLPNAEIRRMSWREFKERAGEYEILRKAYPIKVMQSHEVLERAQRCVGQRGVFFCRPR